MSRLGPLKLAIVALLVVGVVAVIRTARVSTRTHDRDLGTTQPIAIGTAVAFAPELDVPAYAFKVAPQTSYEGRVTVSSRPQRGKAGAPPPTGHARMRVSIVLDVRELVPINDTPFQEVTFPATEATTSTFPIRLPPLEAGHHCLVVTALEDPAITIEKPSVDHASVAVVDLATTTPGGEHCAAKPAEHAEVRELALTCPYPVISPVPDMSTLQARMTSGQQAWAQVPSCPGVQAVSTLFVLDGRPVMTAGQFAPFSTPSDGRTRIVRLGALPRGTLRMIVVGPKQSGTYSQGFGSRPVIVH